MTVQVDSGEFEREIERNALEDADLQYRIGFDSEWCTNLVLANPKHKHIRDSIGRLHIEHRKKDGINSKSK
jgi:hypothetical protein